MTEADNIRAKIRDVPLFSHSAMKLLQVTNTPLHNLQDVVKVLEADSVLTAQILKAVNSAAFGLIDPVVSVSRAASFLGDKTIVGLAIGHSQSQVYMRKLDGYDSETGDLWEHSLRTAIASRELAKYAKGNVSPELAYTAGILHDIGKSMISEFLRGKIQSMITYNDAAQSTNFLEAERNAIGIDHCEAGRELAEHWRLSPVFQATCAHHHFPAKANEENRTLVFIVHLGDALAMMGGSGTGADTMQYTIDPGHNEYIAVNHDDINNVMMKVMIEFEKTKGLLLK